MSNNEDSPSDAYPRIFGSRADLKIERPVETTPDVNMVIDTSATPDW